MLAEILAAGVLATVAPDVGNRIQAARESEQALQGPLDGAWTLRDARRRRLFDLQLVDGGETLGGAWRDPEQQLGALANIRRTAATLHFTLAEAPDHPLRIDLTKSPQGEWRGWLRSGPTTTAVILRRN